MNTNQYTASEFKKMLATGKITPTKGGRLSMSEDLPEVDVTPNTEGYMFNPDDYIFIPGRVYSSKNTPQIRIKLSDRKATNWMCKVKTAKGMLWKYVIPFVSKNDNAAGYMEKKAGIYSSFTERFIGMYKGRGFPVYVEFIFVMPDKSAWDWNNISQLVQDCMINAKWLPDDSVKFMLPTMPQHPKLPYYINKKTPGVYIRVMP